MTAAARYASVRARQDDAAKKGWRSGFCGLRNPRDSHDRCPGAHPTQPCICGCHQPPPSEEQTVSLSVKAAPPMAAPRSPGFHHDIPEADYHDDRTSLSHSGAKELLKAPAIFKWHQDHPEHKDVWDVGSGVHALVLGAGIETIYVAPFDSWQTKQAQIEKRLAREEGLSPILPKDWELAHQMADKLLRHRTAAQLLTGGHSEVTAYAVHEETGVLRRCRYDKLHDDLGVDYKTADSADPQAFARVAPKFGYHQQHAWYLDVAETLGREMRGFVFVVQEKAAPFLVSVCELVPDAVAMGRARNRLALQRYRDCMESGLWPEYGPDDQIIPIDLPGWAYYQETA